MSTRRACSQSGPVFGFGPAPDRQVAVCRRFRRGNTLVNPLSIKGIGELSNVGMNADVAVAVFHATGVRVREIHPAGKAVAAPRRVTLSVTCAGVGL
jgi:hypothetical protein